MDDTRLLALLVHRRLIAEAAARRAFASGDPLGWLVQNGVATAAQVDEWRATAAGTRPVLSRYQLGEVLGEGGMARVFAATDRTDGSRVALKVLRPELARDPVQVERFVREARLLMQLDHPHIVKGHRVAREGEVFFFAMEVLPGRCLQDLLAEEGRLDEESALSIVAEVAAALQHLHGRGLVHRDVKPGNVIWSEERGSVLIDLGFAVAGGSTQAGAVPTGGTGGSDSSASTAGTVHYIAPEQARGGDLDVRADIYALGATLYHLATGSLPFEGGTGEEVLRKQVLESLSGDRIRALGLSPQLHYFIAKMMAKEREIRFQSPAALQEEVEACLRQKQHERELQARAEDGRRPRGRSSMFQRRRGRPRR